MDSDGVPVDMDYTKVEAINPRRTNAFVNNFITTNNHFVNRYLATCEERLAEVEQAETHLGALVATLEAKLASVAFLQESLAAEAAAAPPPAPPPQPPAQETAAVDGVSVETNGGAVEESAAPISSQQEVEPESANRIAASKHPLYKRYFDMKKYGVPDGQIQMSMRTQGVDPAMIHLDNPDELIEFEGAPVAEATQNAASSESSEDSDQFSD